jgi:hypothetical protein
MNIYTQIYHSTYPRSWLLLCIKQIKDNTERSYTNGQQSDKL